jgi:CheY-like chemotaxis protein
MGGGSDSKKQLGKISLQQKRVNAASRRDAVEEARDSGKEGRRDQAEAGAAAQAPPVKESGEAAAEKLSRQEALRVLSEQYALPAVDLSEQVISLSTLRLLPLEIARERSIFAFRVEGDQLMLAMSSPVDRELIEELEFVTAKKIQAFVALHGMIREITEDAYGSLQRGEEYYVAAHVHAGQIAVPPSVEHAPRVRAERVSEWQPSQRPVMPPKLDEAFGLRMPPSQPPERMRVATDSRVLVALRDAALRAACKAAFEASGVPMIELDDGQKALESVRDDKPQVLVLENALPGIHGLDVCRRLRANSRYASLPIVVVSQAPIGWRLAADLRERYGLEHFFDPPIDVPRLAQTVSLLLLGRAVPEEPPPLSAESEARWNDAMEAFHGGDIDRAILELETSVKLEPQAFELHYHLGLLYGRRDDLFAAISALESALKLQPRSFLASKNLATLYQRAGLHHRCLDSWQRAMLAAPDDETRASLKQHIVAML